MGEVAVEVERALAGEAEGGHGGERSGGGAQVEDGLARVGDDGRGRRGRTGGVVLPAEVVAERADVRERGGVVRGVRAWRADHRHARGGDASLAHDRVDSARAEASLEGVPRDVDARGDEPAANARCARRRGHRRGPAADGVARRVLGRDRGRDEEVGGWCRRTA